MRLLSLVSLVLLFAVTCGAAGAHQPRIVEGNNVRVSNPEVSQAFYAELNGQPQIYTIRTDGIFDLYVQLTIPDRPEERRDFTVRVCRGRGVLAVLKGDKAEWKKFYEPFGRDNYLLGPEFEKAKSPAGEYVVKVSNKGDNGKYVLVIGRREEFPPSEMMNALKLMPKVKEFMNTPPAKPRKP